MTALHLSEQVIHGRPALVLTGSMTFDHRHKLPALGGRYNPDTNPKQWEMPDTQEVRDYWQFMLECERNAPPKRGRGRPRKYNADGTPIEPQQEAPGGGMLIGDKDGYILPNPGEYHRVPQEPDGEDKAQQIARLLRELSGGKAQVDESEVRAIVESYMEALGAQIDDIKTALEGKKTERLEIMQGGQNIRVLEGLTHAKLSTLIRCLSVGLNVWLSGPMGAGKTRGAEQAAEALGLSFGMHGAMTMAYELTGFVDASGRYHDTPFVRAFRDGGLVLLDEIDAGSNEALLALNGALANGVMCLPNGQNIRKHADFRCIGAGNTFGGGATHEYIGRTKIDAAFLDRFGAKIAWGYDAALELAIASNNAWTARVQEARTKAAVAGLKVAITPRASQAGALLIDGAGFTPQEAAELTYLATLSADQRKLIGA